MEAERCDLLIVEDEESIRRLLEVYFKRMVPKIRIQSAKDGQEGYRLALEFRPRVIWTCIRMPRFNGLQLIKLIKKSRDIRDAKIIVFSGYGSKEVREQVFESGADAFLDKFDHGQLEEGIKMVANFLKMKIREV